MAEKLRRRVFEVAGGQVRLVFEGSRLTVQMQLGAARRWMAVDRYTLSQESNPALQGIDSWWNVL